MKIVILALVFACLTFPAFSQDAIAERQKTLGNYMDSTLSSSNSKLEEFNRMLAESGNGKSWANYRDRYNSLSKALEESEFRLNRLIQFRDRPSNIKEERDNYQRLIKRLDNLKAEYDEWMSSIQ